MDVFLKRIILIFCGLLSVTCMANQVHVAFLGPKLGENAFWDSMLKPLPTVAKQLGVRLTFHHADFNDRFDYYPKAQNLLTSNQKPDYLISAFRGASAKPLLELAEKYKTPLVTVSSGIPKQEKEMIGYPQQHYKYWLAQILADDEMSGYLQANQLLKIAQEIQSKNPERTVINRTFNMVAIGGGLVLETSQQKDAGLHRAATDSEKLKLLQLVHADWNFDRAMRMTSQLLQRYASVDLIWAANDDMARAAYRASRKLLGDVEIPLIAGIDWTSNGLNSVQKGELAFSLGGNHMQAVWALILVYDIAHGFKASVFENNTYRIPFLIADHKNIQQIKAYIDNDGFLQKDFRFFSKVFNKDLKQYDFNLEKLIFD